MVFLCGKVSVIVALGRGYTIVRFSDEESGLYVSRLTNDFGTPLAARGSRMELEAFVAEHT